MSATSTKGGVWIAVSKHAPKQWQHVLVRRKDGAIRDAYYETSWDGDFTTASNQHAGGHCVTNVTHWMPLPKEPK